MHVLLIEDNPGDAELIRHSMSAYKDEWRVTHVASLEDGLKTLSSQSDFDVVLLDLTLPDSDPYETFSEFNQLDSPVPVVVLSDVEDHDLAVEAVRAGAQDFLFKSATEPHRILRSLLYAVERNAIHRNKSQSVGPARRQVPETSQDNKDASRAKTPDAANEAALEDRNAPCHEEAVSVFKQIVELSLDSRTFKVDHRISDRLALLGEILGDQNALPSDAYSVYRIVVESLCEDRQSTLRTAIKTEAQLMLAGLLSKLASYYRKLWLGQNPHSNVAAKCNTGSEARE